MQREMLVNCLGIIKHSKASKCKKKIENWLRERKLLPLNDSSKDTHRKRVEIHLTIFERKKKKPIDNEQLPIADIFFLSLTRLLSRSVNNKEGRK